MATNYMPVKGLHMKFPVNSDLNDYEKFILEVLPRETVNTLILQIDYNFPFKSHPELNENGIALRDIKRNNTYSAIDDIPKDIIICDWHYNTAYNTPGYFIDKGFKVVVCPWQKSAVALDQLNLMKKLAGDRAGGDSVRWLEWPAWPTVPGLRSGSA